MLICVRTPLAVASPTHCKQNLATALPSGTSKVPMPGNHVEVKTRFYYAPCINQEPINREIITFPTHSLAKANGDRICITCLTPSRRYALLRHSDSCPLHQHQHEATRVDAAGTLKLRFCILFLFIDFLLRIFYIFLSTSPARFH